MFVFRDSGEQVGVCIGGFPSVLETMQEKAPHSNHVNQMLRNACEGNLLYNRILSLS